MLFKLSALRLTAWELGTDGGFRESKALLGAFPFTKSAQTLKDLFTERKLFSSLTRSLSEPSFLNGAGCLMAGGSLKGKGCHHRKDDIQMQTAQTAQPLIKYSAAVTVVPGRARAAARTPRREEVLRVLH